jgi:HTH-type transcriptional regulator, bacterioopsin transcriptional activator and related proteins
MTTWARHQMNDLTPIVTLQWMIDASPLALVGIGLDGRVSLWNPAAERIFGWSPDEVLGRTAPYVPMESADEHRDLLAATFNGETLVSAEISRQTKSGSLIQLSRSTAPLRDREGAVQGLICIFAVKAPSRG